MKQFMTTLSTAIVIVFYETGRDLYLHLTVFCANDPDKQEYKIR